MELVLYSERAKYVEVYKSLHGAKNVRSTDGDGDCNCDCDVCNYDVDDSSKNNDNSNV